MRLEVTFLLPLVFFSSTITLFASLYFVYAILEISFLTLQNLTHSDSFMDGFAPL